MNHYWERGLEIMPLQNYHQLINTIMMDQLSSTLISWFLGILLVTVLFSIFHIWYYRKHHNVKIQPHKIAIHCVLFILIFSVFSVSRINNNELTNMKSMNNNIRFDRTNHIKTDYHFQKPNQIQWF